DWLSHATPHRPRAETQRIATRTSANTKWISGDTNHPGRPPRVVEPRGNTTGTPDLAYSTLLAYDASGNLTSATDADQNQTTNGFDNVGRRTSMVDPDGNAVGGVPAEHTWLTGYDALDR